jgi:hypothetical protein
MTDNVTSTGGVPDSTYGSARRRPDAKPAAPSSEPAPAPPPPPGADDLMLVIEQDPDVGGFVYTTIDRRTGAVIQRLSRAQLLKLRQASSYAAGAVLRTRA